MSTRFLDALKTGRVILMDGAMGTELIREGLDVTKEQPYHWCKTRERDVCRVHFSYWEAGAQCFLTNSFTACRDKDDNNKVNYLAEAAKVARLYGPPQFLLLDLGCGVGALKMLLVLQMGRRILFGCDAGLLETVEDFLDVQSQVEHLWFGPFPVVVSFSFCRRDGELITPGCKSSPEAIGQFFQEHHAAILALGVNCGRDMGMDDIIEVVRRYRKVTDLPILARPNAGTPIRMGDRWVYPHSPSSMAAKLPELIEAGATLIGGCCGTTPAHIAAFREVIERMGVGWKP